MTPMAVTSPQNRKEIDMNKAEAVKAMGLTKRDGTELIFVSNFDVPQNEVWRAIYTDGNGDEWVWLWGEFYRCERASHYGYRVL